MQQKPQQNPIEKLTRHMLILGRGVFISLTQTIHGKDTRTVSIFKFSKRF